MNNPKDFVEYLPPNSEIIRAFARCVCESLAQQTNNSIFIQHDVIHGLAELLDLAARVQAKQLNSDQLVDKVEK